MVGMLFNNILYCFSDIYIISYILDFIIGNSITTTFLLYVCSYVFGFSIERELQLMIQEELINSVKDKVAASPRGKELLKKQLNNIKVKKEEIIKEANKNIEVFKRFQEAARLNPNLTYVEFVKSLN